ncbi:universal stress protein [Streptomyces sp. NPDC049944]|uniref:universal stress protein n=1 Tax=Streptomyces sp. NPDC049944 TaxID=3155657 RepID=UPI003432452D
MSQIVSVGIDGSRESLAAVNWAADEALLRGCPLLLLHVWRDGDAPEAHHTNTETGQRSAEVLLRRAAERVRLNHPRLQIDTQQQPGDPVEELLAAGERSALMVLGSRGLGGLGGFIVGSVSLAVLARARCPLVLVRAESPDDLSTRSSAGDIVVGMDLPEAGQEVLGFAFACAERYGSGLRIVHSWSLPPLFGPGTTDVVPALMEEVATGRREEMTRALASWREKYPTVPVGSECLQGHPAQDLVEASRKARLVVVGLRRRASRLGAHVGPVVHSVLHHTAAPVAVVPHG